MKLSPRRGAMLHADRAHRHSEAFRKRWLVRHPTAHPECQEQGGCAGQIRFVGLSSCLLLAGCRRTCSICRFRPIGMDRNLRRQPWAKDIVRGTAIEKDLDRDTLSYLRKISGGVIGWQERCRRSARRRYLAHMAVKDL